MTNATDLAAYTSGVLRARTDYRLHNGTAATCPKRRPCRTCAPELHACTSCGATVTGCHREGGRCCDHCPHTHPNGDTAA
jgi:hypothetical protein